MAAAWLTYLRSVLDEVFDQAGQTRDRKQSAGGHGGWQPAPAAAPLDDRANDRETGANWPVETPDFAIVETIKYLRVHNRHGLGLNFATMRAVLAGEAGEGLTQRVQAWLLRRMSDSMQIESLWKFNAKYEPEWLPRYVVFDTAEHLVPVVMAILRAESVWEIPVQPIRAGRWRSRSVPT